MIRFFIEDRDKREYSEVILPIIYKTLFFKLMDINQNTKTIKFEKLKELIKENKRLIETELVKKKIYDNEKVNSTISEIMIKRIKLKLTEFNDLFELAEYLKKDIGIND